MTKNSTTSVIILTKNRAKLLEKNLLSLAKQSIQPNEIIIVDNNSADQTPQVIKKYQKILPIRCFKNTTSGYSELYNFGIQKARCKLLCFLDDDCLADKNWIKNLVEKSHQYPNSIVQGNTFSLPKNNLYAEIMGNHYQNYLKSNIILGEELRFLDNKNLAVPKKIIKKYGGFSQKQNLGSEDIEFGLRMRRNGVKIIFQSKAIAWHYERDNLKDFIKQHYHIAKSQSALDKNLRGNKEKVGLFPKKKTLMNLKSALASEMKYLLRGKFIKALQLLFIYLLLFILRVVGYLKQKLF